MDGELSAYIAFKAAIVDYEGYTTPWDRTTFDVESFDDIPNGTMHNGHCPFIAFKGGVTDGFTNMAGDLYSGEMVFEIMLCLSQPLIKGSAEWNLMKTWTGEVERAVATLNGNGFTMPPSSGRSNPISLNQMITRELSFDCQFSECRAAAGPPTFQSPPVLTGTPKEGETLTVSNGTVIGTDPITYSYDWLKDGVSIGAPDQNTYLVMNGDENTTISCEVTASNNIAPDAVEESNGLLIVAMLPPENQIAPAITGTPEPDEVLTCSNGTWTGEAPITFTYTWYKDTVLIPLETANTYTVLIGDVGSDIYCEVLASNVVTGPFPAGVGADSNSLEIVSGFEVFPAPYTAGYFHYHAGETPFGNALDMRVVTTEQANGYDEFGKYDTDSHDSFQTTQGGGTVFTPKLYDSKGLYDAVQSSEPGQPSADNDGTINWGLSSTTKIGAPIPLSSTDGFSCAFPLNIPAFQDNFHDLINSVVPGRIQVEFLSDGQVRVTIDGNESFIDPNIYGVGWKIVTIVYHTDAPVSFKVNDVEQTHNSDNFGALSTASTDMLFYNDSNNGNEAVLSSRAEVVYDGEWTDQQTTDIVTWFTNAGYLT